MTSSLESSSFVFSFITFYAPCLPFPFFFLFLLLLLYLESFLLYIYIYIIEITWSSDMVGSQRSTSAKVWLEGKMKWPLCPFHWLPSFLHGYKFLLFFYLFYYFPWNPCLFSTSVFRKPVFLKKKKLIFLYFDILILKIKKILF